MAFPKSIVCIVFFFIITGFAGFVQKAQAQARYSSHHPPFSVEILSSTTALGEATEILMGLRFKLAPSWKIYAPDKKNMSSAFSSAPEINWSRSKNVQNIDILWPNSNKYSIEGLIFHAYEGEVIIPLVVKLVRSQEPLVLHLHLTYSVCSKVCMPIRHELTFTVAPGSANSTSATDLLRKLKGDAAKGLEAGAFQEERSYLMMLIFAFLGGITLNFMPCVLPVISLKMMSIAKKGRSSARHLHFRPSFLATFAGIMMSFIFLGGLAVLLDTLGASVGWGIHFQQPSFLGFLIVLTTLFASNLWGFYDIELPLSVREGINKLLGYEHEHHAGLVEDFVAGIFATLLATPCTAPFLGTALGYAFSRSGAEIFLFFIVLGAGFSLPYWLGAILPRYWLKLPKPGSWMLTLSHILGYVLAVTTLWLLWILSETASGVTAFYVGAGALVMIFLFWLGQKRSNVKKLNWLVVVFMLVVPLVSVSSPPVNSYGKEQWRRFKPELISTLVRQEKTVVVDITAAWCLTCKVNKVLVFDSKEGEKLLSQKDIVLMRADWTRHDPLIANYLASYGRAGIPFNIVFGPYAPEGIILPEIFNIESLRNALSQATKPQSPLSSSKAMS
ncbi:MAG: thioredoxin family protein [Caedimonas sp.]|nr:thioredoxin family protein [Caedimonas sp.]